MENNSNNTNFGGDPNATIGLLDPSILAEVLSNQNATWAESNLKLEPCVPGQDEKTISRRAYTHWRESVLAAFEAFPMMTEVKKFSHVKRWAGPLILDILDNLSVGEKLVDSVYPFSDAINKWDGFFNSEQSKQLAKINFRVIQQSTKESCMDFCNKLGRGIGLCGLSPADEDCELVLAVALRATNVKLQEEATRHGSTFASIKAVAQSQDMLSAIQQANEVNLRKSKTTDVNAVSSSNESLGKGRDDYEDRRYQSRRDHDYRDRSEHYDHREQSFDRSFGQGRRFDGYAPRRDSSRAQGSSSRNLGAPRKQCYRCGDWHDPQTCHAMDKKCFKCQKIGHVIRMCKGAVKRRSSPEASQERIKKIKKDKVINKLEEFSPKVSQSDSSSSGDEVKKF